MTLLRLPGSAPEMLLQLLTVLVLHLAPAQHLVHPLRLWLGRRILLQ
jgi:hypothetical protein